jgi:hypothetical protein
MYNTQVYTYTYSRIYVYTYIHTYIHTYDTYKHNEGGARARGRPTGSQPPVCPGKYFSKVHYVVAIYRKATRALNQPKP